MEGNNARPIYAIAEDVRKAWKKPYFGAEPYIDAMRSLDKISDDYGADSGKSIVAYFLANATTFRGPEARALKSELKKIAGIK